MKRKNCDTVKTHKEDYYIYRSIANWFCCFSKGKYKSEEQFAFKVRVDQALEELRAEKKEENL